MKKILLSIIIFASLFLFFDNTYSQVWLQQNSNTTNQLNSVSVYTIYRAWVCGNNGTVLRTTNQGNNWINVTGNGIPTSLDLNNIFMHKNTQWYSRIDYAYVTGTDVNGSYIYMTTNAGSNWNKVLTVTGSGARINGIWFNDTAKGFAAGEPIAGRWSFWKTTNGGYTWDSAGLYLNGQNYTGFPNNLSGNIYSTYSYLYIGANYNNSETRILRSTNYGTNWTVLNPGISKKINSIFFFGPDFGMIGGDNYLYKTTNYGNNWNLSVNLPYTPNLVAIASEGMTFLFYLKTDSTNTQTFYVSWDLNTWHQQVSGINGIRHMQSVMYDLWAVGDSGKIYHRFILYPYVKKIGNKFPEVYKLYQNYPNPFNPTTTIKFDLKKSSDVKLIVFDIQGKEITKLVNEKFNAGSYEVDWSASDYSSGVYYYKLITDDFVDVKKMVLIK